MAAIQIVFNPISVEVIIGIIILIILLIFSGSVSGSEVAFFSLSPNDNELLRSSSKKSHKNILELSSIPDKLLATILVANNFVNIAIVILSTFIFHSLIDFSQAPILGFLIEIILITFILLLFGEILPKIYASNYSMWFAGFMARPLQICAKIFKPLIAILIKSTDAVNKRLAVKNRNISIDEISQALELTNEEEISEEKGILEGIVKFGTTEVDEIMTPRTDVTGIEKNYTLQKVINIINQTGYSRIPVYEDNFDNVVGILYIKDLLPNISTTDFQWQTIIRSSYFVPENKKIDDLLKEFQKEKVHMAIVVDEYGGSSGIVTLEDILEEIVGDIVDEFDDDDRLYAKLNENTFIFDGKTQLNDFYRICNLDDHYFEEVKGDADTLAGLILENKGDFPKLNEHLTLINIDFIVEAIDNRRIKKIKVIFNQQQ